MATRSPITKSPVSLCEDAERNKHWIYGILVATVGAIGYLLGDRWFLQLLLAGWFGYMLTNNRYQWLYIFRKTVRRDLRAVFVLMTTIKQLWMWERGKKTVLKVFTENVQKYPQKVAFYFEDQSWTFQQLDDYSNRIAWYFKKQGFKRGDVIALVMESRPEFLAVWLGLGKIGIVTALINTNIRGSALLHSIKAAVSKGLIFSSECLPGVEEVRGHSDVKDVPLFQYNTSDVPILPDAIAIVPEIQRQPTTQHLEDIAKGNFKDKLIYIYTSGTTGFPKAAVITNSRYLMIPFALVKTAKLTLDDIIYVPLPLYHTSGGVLGAGQSLIMARTVALRKKFSASNFWKDCIKYNCTASQYIGEMCRYLLNQPPSDLERKHKVRVIFGNGLRRQIWRQFVERFGISDIKEFYGATEGNTNMINLPSKEGAIGFICRFDSIIYPLGLVRCDETTGEILRDKNGFCVECQPFEPGIILGKINEKKVIQAFTGYVDKKATEKKLVRNVFRQGDCYFNSGDILIMDHYGFFYFKDRTGDTFRWKGENVSTCEVEAVLSNVVGLKDVIVYGTKIPHVEGRAGMAAIVDPSKQLKMSDLTAWVNKMLPSYARPMFIRILSETPLTATFKLKKVDLVEEAFDLERVKDDLYFLDPKQGYVPFTRPLYDDLLDGKLRL